MPCSPAQAEGARHERLAVGGPVPFPGDDGEPHRAIAPRSGTLRDSDLRTGLKDELQSKLN